MESRDKRNKYYSFSHDEALEMCVIRHLNCLRSTKFEQLWRELAWMWQFGVAFDSLASALGGSVGSGTSRYDEFDEQGFRNGYVRGWAQALNVMHMVQSMDRIGHLGVDFLQEKHITR